MKTGKYMWWVRSVAIILLCASGAWSARAAEFAAGVNVSTLGPGVSVTVGLSERVNARLGYGSISETDEVTESGVNYDMELELKGTSLLLDWHPFGGNFRLSAGIVRNGSQVTGDAVLAGPVTIGDITYTPAQVGGLDATIDFEDNAGYLGIGWGNAVALDAGLTLGADLGVMITGSPRVDLDQVGGTITIPESEVVKEEESLESDIEEFEFYPIVRIGLAYHF